MEQEKTLYHVTPTTRSHHKGRRDRSLRALPGDTPSLEDAMSMSAEAFIHRSFVHVAVQIDAASHAGIPRVITAVVKDIEKSEHLPATEAVLRDVPDPSETHSPVHAMSIDGRVGREGGGLMHASRGEKTAGSRGIRVRYVCRNTPGYLPLAFDLACRLGRNPAIAGTSGTFPFPEENTQSGAITRYDPGKPVKVHAIALSAHQKDSTKVGDEIAGSLSRLDLAPLMVKIMNNLVVTSIEYAFAGRDEGTIKLHASLKETGVDMVIEDDGKGIPEWIESTGSRVFDMQHAGSLHQGCRGNLQLSLQEEDSLFTIELEA